jgi:hypothetical protein
MSLTFEDFEKNYPASKSSESQNQTSTSPKIAKKAPVARPSISEAASQAWDMASPVIAKGLERAVNPFHYKGDQEDYTNIDWPLTALHAGGEAVAAKRLWDFATGKSEEREIKRMTAEQWQRQNDIAEANRETRNAPKPTPGPAPAPQPAAQTTAAPAPVAQATSPVADRTIGGPAQTDVPAYLRKQKAAAQAVPQAAVPTAPAAPISPTVTPEQAAASLAQMPEHQNPITKVGESTLNQIGASNLAGQTKEATAQQKKITGKAGAAVPAVKELTQGVAKATSIEPFARDAAGNIQWPEKMSPAARSGAEAFAQQFPDFAKELEAKGKFGILGAGKGDNNLYNSYGADFAKTLRNEVNQGQMVGPSVNYTEKVNPAIQGIPPESDIGKQLAEIRAANPQGGTFGTLGQGAAIKEGKLITAKNSLNPALKGGAAAALIMSIADAANAAQAKGQTLSAVVPPQAGGGAYIGYPNLQRQGQAIQKAGEARIPENINDPATYAAVRGFLTGNPESDISVLSGKRKKAQEAAYYGSQISNLLQMLGR